MDILYIKGKESPNQDLEMLYSFRSLSYVEDLNRVFIVGELPKFVGNVTYIPAEDIGCKMVNHWWKVQEAIKHSDISDNFALMYDDIFFTRNVKLENYPFYNRGLLGESQSGTDLYRLNLNNAKKWLIEHNYPIRDYELHIPCIYNREKFLKLNEIFEPYKNRGNALAVRSIYGNIFVGESPCRKDVKIRSLDELDDTECFSTTDDTFRDILPFLREKFKERSKYENSILC